MKDCLLIILVIVLCYSCSIEKRRYMSGYHVTFHQHHVREAVAENKILPGIELSEQIKYVLPDTSLQVKVQRDTLEHCPAERGGQPREVTGEIHAKDTETKIRLEANALLYPSNVDAEIHPAAAGSFVSGLLSALCFVMLFVLSFTPVWAVIALVTGVVVFAVIARKLSAKAFDEMYYARNRYSGRALAAAGLALGVVSLVALIGLLAIIIFGIAFVTIA